VSYIFHCDLPAVADPGDELAIQVRLRARCKMLAPTMRLVATPNGAKRTAYSAMKAKAEGMSKGFPDLNALAPNFNAYLEIKARAGSLSTEQVEWLNFLHRCGFPSGCFRSVDTAVAFLIDAGAPFLSAKDNFTRDAA
jgi:hypothetical protein